MSLSEINELFGVSASPSPSSSSFLLSSSLSPSISPPSSSPFSASSAPNSSASNGKSEGRSRRRSREIKDQSLSPSFSSSSSSYPSSSCTTIDLIGDFFDVKDSRESSPLSKSLLSTASSSSSSSSTSSSSSSSTVRVPSTSSSSSALQASSLLPDVSNGTIDDWLAVKSYHPDVKPHVREFDQIIDQDQVIVLNENETNEQRKKRMKMKKSSKKDFEEVEVEEEGEDEDELMEKKGFKRLPFWSHIDDGQHGLNVGDHNRVKTHYQGYWEGRIAKLRQQRPNEEVLRHSKTFGKFVPHVQISGSVATSSSSSSSSLATSEHTDAQETTSLELFKTTPSRTSLKSNSYSSSASSSSSSLSSPEASKGIFKNVVAYFNGNIFGAEETCAATLADIIQVHEGEVLPVFSRSNVTHVIINNLSLRKHLQEFERKFLSNNFRRQPEFVKKEWILECLEAGKLVSCLPYRIVVDAKQRTLKSMMSSPSTSIPKS